MTTRIRLDNEYGARLEDINEPPGLGPLRTAINRAHESGDLAELELLQRQYRAAVHGPTTQAPGTGAARVRAAGRPAGRSARRPADPLRAEVPGRTIVGYVCTWHTLTASQEHDGFRCWAAVLPGALDRCLAGHPSQVPLVAAVHRTDALGHFARFEADSIGLRGLAYVYPTPAGDVLLEAADDGRCPGLSISGDVLSSHQRPAPGLHGWPVFDVDALDLIDVAATAEAADERCLIELVGGRRPTFLRELDAMARDDLMRGLDRSHGW